PGIDRRRDAVGGEVGGTDRAIVNDREVAVPPSEVTEVHGKTGHKLLLNAGRELRVPRPVSPAIDRLRIDSRAGAKLTEQGVRQRTTVTVGGRIVQVALRCVVIRIP